MTREARRSLRRRRVLTAVIAAATCLTAVGVSPVLGARLVRGTDAAWTDAQLASGRVSAGQLTTPRFTGCVAANDAASGVFASVDLAWTSTVADPSLMRLDVSAGGTGAPLPAERATVTGPVDGEYAFAVQLTAAEIEAAAGSIAGTTLTLALSSQAGDWTSPGSSERSLAVGSFDGGTGSATCDLRQSLELTGLTGATAAVGRTIPVGTPETSSLPDQLQDRRRTPEYTATLRDIATGTAVDGGELTIVLPEGFAFESGDAAGMRRATFTTDASGRVVFRVVADRSAAAQGPIRLESSAALSVRSAQPIVSVPLVAWGYNAEYQTGSDQAGNRLSAVPLWDRPDITGATALGSSYSALLYADQNGMLWGRGYNASGSIGDGTTTNRADAVPAITAEGSQLGDIIQIGRGTDQLAAVAVDAAGGVWATGVAEYGGFGPGYSNIYRWQRISDTYDLPAGVGAISAQVNPWGNVLMVLDNGQAMVAGADSYGYAAQGGTVSTANGTRGLIMLTAADTPITGVVSGGIGWEHSAVVTSDGKLYTAGTAAYGGGGSSRYLVEKPLPEGKSAASVVVGEYKTLVLMTDGSAYALGSNTSGALGVGSSASPGATLTPVAIPGWAQVRSAAMGNDASLFLLESGAVLFAGYNDTGVSGSGAAGGTFYTPTQVPLAHTARQVAATWWDTYFAELG